MLFDSLIKSIDRQDLAAFKGFLEKKRDQVNRAVGGEYPIHKAIRARNLEIVKALVDAGADLSVKDGNGQNVLRFATELAADRLRDEYTYENSFPVPLDEDVFQVVSYLLDILSEQAGPGLIQSIIAIDRVDAIARFFDLLISKGLRPKAVIGDRDRTLAMGDGNHAFSVFRKYGIEPPAEYGGEDTILHSAARMFSLKRLEATLDDFSGNIDAQDRFGQTALLIAARYGNDKHCEALLRRGANADLRDAEGRAPLFRIMNVNASSSYMRDRIPALLVEKTTDQAARALYEALYVSGGAFAVCCCKCGSPVRIESAKAFLKDLDKGTGTYYVCPTCSWPVRLNEVLPITEN